VLASGTELENLLGGMFIIVIAGLMPFATARVLPLAAEELPHGHQGRVRGLVVGGAILAGRTVSSALMDTSTPLRRRTRWRACATLRCWGRNSASR
jgi:hypothetical protein